jgi:hypothetical protein
MDNVPFPSFGSFGFAFLFIPMLIQLVWYVAVIVFLYKIWKKVKHLPG